MCVCVCSFSLKIDEHICLSILRLFLFSIKSFSGRPENIQLDFFSLLFSDVTSLIVSVIPFICTNGVCFYTYSHNCMFTYKYS